MLFAGIRPRLARDVFRDCGITNETFMPGGGHPISQIKISALPVIPTKSAFVKSMSEDSGVIKSG